MTTLCGHNREHLMIGLEMVALYDEESLAIACAKEHPYAYAMRDGTDPAKLAELMAEELRRRGFDTWLDGAPRTVPPRKDQFTLFPYADAIQVYPPTSEDDERSKLLVMSQARAALLRLMQFPEGTPVQDVLKALEVGT